MIVRGPVREPSPIVLVLIDELSALYFGFQSLLTHFTTAVPQWTSHGLKVQANEISKVAIRSEEEVAQAPKLSPRSFEGRTPNGEGVAGTVSE